MHRTALGVLISSLALTLAAVVTPHGNLNQSAPQARDVAAVTELVPAVDRVVRAVPTRECHAGLVALTFDDGPSPTVTPVLVRTLLKLHAPATFFMVGQRLGGASAAGRLVSRSGFAIGNHSWSHPMLTDLSNAQIKSELLRTRRLMRADHLTLTDLMRPPYGAVNARVLKVIKSLGFVPVLWTVDSGDWRGGAPQEIAHAVLSHLMPNRPNIVLQHDGVNNSPNSVKAVPAIVHGARARGFCLTTVGPNGTMAVPVPQLRVSTVAGTEAGPSPIRVRLDLDRPTTRTVSVRVRTEPGTATPGQDYTSRVIRVVFPRGARTASFTIGVRDDAEPEGVENVQLVFDEPTGLSIARSVVLASIISNE